MSIARWPRFAVGTPITTSDCPDNRDSTTDHAASTVMIVSAVLLVSVVVIPAPDTSSKLQAARAPGFEPQVGARVSLVPIEHVDEFVRQRCARNIIGGRSAACPWCRVKQRHIHVEGNIRAKAPARRAVASYPRVGEGEI